MTPTERFAHAIQACRAGAWRCPWCFTSDVGVDHLPAGEQLWQRHVISPITDDWCPCFSDRRIMRQVALDLLDALVELAAPICDYEPEPWFRRSMAVAS